MLILDTQILATCQTATVFNACEHGLGQHFEILTSQDRDVFFKVTHEPLQNDIKAINGYK